jgi:phosphoglycerol transferase
METRRIHAGQYQVRLRPEKLPNHSFWLEAVSPDGKVIHAREWVRVDPNARDRRQIRLPVWLDKAVDQLVIRAWLDYTEDMKVDRVAMVRDRSRRGGS